jgi:hypothetical protein
MTESAVIENGSGKTAFSAYGHSIKGSLIYSPPIAILSLHVAGRVSNNVEFDRTPEAWEEILHSPR